MRGSPAPQTACEDCPTHIQDLARSLAGAIQPVRASIVLAEKLLRQCLHTRSLLVGDHSRETRVRRGVEKRLDLGRVDVCGDTLVFPEKLVGRLAA